MPTVPFGDKDNFAIVAYDRSVQFCCIVANSAEHFDSAVAVVHSLKAPECLLIVPADLDISRLKTEEMDVKVYRYGK
jgi:hypothetical protein